MTKYLNKQIFTINSNDRDSGTHSDFMITLPLYTQDVDRVVVLDASIKRSFYLIEDGQNTFTLTENDQSTSITIPPGNYNFGSFRLVLQNLLNTFSPKLWTYSITVPNTATSASTGKYTFTCAGGDPAFTFSEHLHEQFGFEAGSTNLFVGGTLISANPVFFNKDTLHIHSDMCSNGSDNILQVVSASGADFSSLKYLCLDVEANSKPMTKRSNIFRFTILDENHKHVTLALNVLFTIMFYKHSDLTERYQEMNMEFMRYQLMKS